MCRWYRKGNKIQFLFQMSTLSVQHRGMLETEGNHSLSIHIIILTIFTLFNKRMKPNVRNVSIFVDIRVRILHKLNLSSNFIHGFLRGLTNFTIILLVIALKQNRNDPMTLILTSCFDFFVGRNVFCF